jgi:hypothetical protein
MIKLLRKFPRLAFLSNIKEFFHFIYFKQTEFYRIKRSSSLPNLRNSLTPFKCVYCCYYLKKAHNNGNQSTQTSTEDDNNSNNSINVLTVPSSERNLRHQLTKDSGIELNISKSKSNSYSSTPIDPSDLALSSTRNNSLDCINKFDEQMTIINEISKENDVLEDSSKKFDNQLEKYNINSDLPQTATNKRKLFKGN